MEKEAYWVTQIRVVSNRMEPLLIGSCQGMFQLFKGEELAGWMSPL